MSDTEANGLIMHFYQGANSIGGEECLKSIKQKIAELCNVKNVSFLLGAGASADAIPSMKELEKRIGASVGSGPNDNIKKLYDDVNSDNLEGKLTILHAKKQYMDGISSANSSDLKAVEDLISCIENKMYSEINLANSDIRFERTRDLYKKFYLKIALRNRDLSRVNIFTTNNDLLSESALDSLSIDYNNGFGGGLERVFNPARFRYTFSKKIDTNLEKFEPLENMVYLYKLHGSISWVEREGESLFNIQEVAVTSGEPKTDDSHVLIYPTPLKQKQSLGSPYADLIREFQTKLSLPNSVLFVIGYSFSDDHLNNIIYQSLASNSSISIVIFGEHEGTPLAKIGDNRIFRIFGSDSDERKVHYFDYIVSELLPNVDDNIDTKLLDGFVSSLKGILENEAAQ